MQKKTLKRRKMFNRSTDREVTVTVKGYALTKRQRERKKIHDAKVARDEEKRIETEKYLNSLALKSKREALCEKLLDKIEARTQKSIRNITLEELDNPQIPFSEIGGKWIFKFDDSGNRSLVKKGYEMKFTGEELVEASEVAVEKILEQVNSGEVELNLTRIHQIFQQEIVNLLDEEVERKIAVCHVLERFFLAQRIALDGLREERKANKDAKREFDITRFTDGSSSARSAVVKIAEKLDKKIEKKILTGFKDKEVPDKMKWKAASLKSQYADLALMDDEKISDLNRKDETK